MDGLKRVVFPLLICLIAIFSPSISLSETVTLRTTRDLWISSAPGEEEGNNGAAPKLKLKGYQEFSIIDFDVSSLKGKVVRKATLHVKSASEERLFRVGISSITAPWVEGTGNGYAKEPGASSFLWSKNPDVPWIHNSGRHCKNFYSDVTYVIFGEGGSIWSNADASDPVDGWQTIDVSPELVYARIAGLSEGFVLFDDTGTEVIRKGNETEIRLFPNRFIYSHDQNSASEPFLELEVDDAPSNQTETASPSELKADTKALPLGSVKLSWRLQNCHEAGVIGFRLNLDGDDLPQYYVPAPALDGSDPDFQNNGFFETRLDNLDATVSHTVQIRSVGPTGESKSEILTFRASTQKFSAWERLVTSEIASESPRPESRRFQRLGALKVAVTSEFEKDAVNGENSSFLWNAEDATINLSAALNEFVGFKFAFRGASQTLRFKVEWDKPEDSAPNPDVQFYRFARVQSPEGAVIDPTIPLDSGRPEVVLRDGSDEVLCELFIPKEARPGTTSGRIEISDSDGRSLTLGISMKIWNFALPDRLSFLPEMNCYSLPENERDYYRMAQLHRTYINRVPYSHRGTTGDGLAPEWNDTDRIFDWNDWEERFGGYFDGSAFADLPRGAVPIEAFYLPLFENFPGNIFEGFTGDFIWPDSSAFTEPYKETMKNACRAFAEKIASESWNDTRFLFFLNNKSDYKKAGWFNASSPWLLDEPASFRDFAALRFFSQILKRSLDDRAEQRGAILFRADVSRPQWERNSLESLLNVYVVSMDSLRRYNKMILGRRDREGRLVYAYGTTAPPSESFCQPIYWSLDAWTLGADGIVPWQTIGNQDSWQNEDELALFYPPAVGTDGKIVPSLRLKAYRAGEQLVEYLTLLERHSGYSREEIAQAVRARLKLDLSSDEKRNAEDAGTSRYIRVLEDLESFRRELGEYLNVHKF